MGTYVSSIVTGFVILAVSGATGAARPIRLVSAVYGDLATQRVCDATSSVASLCDGKAQCVVDIGNGKLCGDPAFLTVKKVRVQYRCGRRPIRSVVVDEYKSVNISCE